MFKVFSRNVLNKEICSPIDGMCIAMEDVNEKVFSSKMLGDGFAIKPVNDIVCAPIDGTISMIADTLHAFGLERQDGLEVLVHIGLDTVECKGKGFEVLCTPGKKVKCGDPIIKFDRNFMEEKELDLTTIVVLTAGYHEEVKLNTYGKIVKTGEVLLR